MLQVEEMNSILEVYGDFTQAEETLYGSNLFMYHILNHLVFSGVEYAYQQTTLYIFLQGCGIFFIYDTI